jgi:regulator of sigma E protease
MGIVIGLLILSVMMIVHELGHFLTGRRLGFKIEEFSIFMGPVLFSWTRRGIKYNIKALPIGASVRFAGEYSEDGTPDDEPGHFFNRPKWARAIVIVTGPLLNLFSGFLAFLLMFSIYGYTIPVIAGVQQGTLAAKAGLQTGERIVGIENDTVRTTLDYSGLEMFISQDVPLTLKVKGLDGTVRTVVLQPEKVARYRLGITIEKVAGLSGVRIATVDATSNGGSPLLKVGDNLLAVNGVAYEDANFAKTIEDSAGNPIRVTVIRDAQTIDLTMKATQYLDPMARGIYFQASHQFLPAVGQSFLWCGSIIKVTLRSIGMMFTGVVKPQDTLSGPVGVVTIISDVVSADQSLADKIYQLLWMFALISVSLGLMNLLPIPPLDGNHLLLIVIEAIRRKRLSEKAQSVIGIAGLSLIILLAAAGLIFDVMRLINR